MYVKKMLFNLQNILINLLFIPLIGVLLLLLVSYKNTNLLKIIALLISSLNFLLSIIVWIFFDRSTGDFQFVNKILWAPNLNINLILGIDGISLFFIILTTLLIFLCLLSSWNSIKNNLKEYLILFLIMEFFLIGVFCVLDVLLFYIFFESVLIPMYLIIGVWGSRERKIRAAYFFFFIYFVRICFNVISSFIFILSSRYYRL